MTSTVIPDSAAVAVGSRDRHVIFCFTQDLQVQSSRRHTVRVDPCNTLVTCRERMSRVVSDSSCATASSSRFIKFTNGRCCRECYKDKSTDELKPGKKGLSLNPLQWEKLADHLTELDTAFKVGRAPSSFTRPVAPFATRARALLAAPVLLDHWNQLLPACARFDLVVSVLWSLIVHVVSP